MRGACADVSCKHGVSALLTFREAPVISEHLADAHRHHYHHQHHHHRAVCVMFQSAFSA